jgi:hypothetical protein
MIWLTWRQHRGEALGAAVLLAALATVLLFTGLPLHSSFTRDGAEACLAVAESARAANCETLISQFADQYQNIVNFIVPWLNLLPALAGVFIGAPLLAREFEHGTWQLAWTQAVPRLRWLLVKLGTLTAAVILFAYLTTWLYTWWHGPVDRIDSRFSPDAFNFEGVALVGYSLFAFGLGTFAGTFIRRSVPAMAATFAGFLVVRLAVESGLRPRYREPLVVMFDPVTEPEKIRSGASGDWVLTRGIADSAGRLLSTPEQAAVVQRAAAAHLDLPTYLHENGLKRWFSYHPADRFWQFQLIELSIFAGLMVLLVAAVVWRIRRSAY